MPISLLSPLKKLIYGDLNVSTFLVTRLFDHEIKESVFLRAGTANIEITKRHGMICLQPFCVAVWLNPEQLETFDPATVKIFFKKGKTLKAKLSLSLVEKIEEGNTALLIYRVSHASCYQLNPLYRFVTLFRFLKNKATTYRQRKFIAALYSYPRKIIVVSYKEENYCNIFPMDIQGHIPESELYILGLRTTNFTLNKILATKKVVISDTNKADIKTIYDLGRHGSSAPPLLDSLPFSVSASERFNFPVPNFSSSYKEVEIIQHRELGYHMLMIGKVVNAVQALPDPSLLYHVHLFEFVNSGYQNAGKDIIF